MKRTKISRLLTSEVPIDTVLIQGWIRTKRDAKAFSFIEVNDGSCLKNLQVVTENNIDNYEDVKKLSTGSAVAVVYAAAVYFRGVP